MRRVLVLCLVAGLGVHVLGACGGVVERGDELGGNGGAVGGSGAVPTAGKPGSGGAGLGPAGGSPGFGGFGGGAPGGGSPGFGGSTPGGGSPGFGGAVSCGNGEPCPEYTVGAIITVLACCKENRCGVVVDATIGGLLGNMPVGCYQTNQHGAPDCACPAFEFTSPLPPNDQTKFPGCCTPTGRCGYVIDVTNLKGPYVGCQIADWGPGQGVSCNPNAGSLCDAGGSN